MTGAPTLHQRGSVDTWVSVKRPQRIGVFSRTFFRTAGRQGISTPSAGKAALIFFSFFPPLAPDPCDYAPLESDTEALNLHLSWVSHLLASNEADAGPAS